MPAFSPKFPRLLLPIAGRFAPVVLQLHRSRFKLLEGAPPGHDGPKGVFSQICRADLQADYFC